MKRIDRMMRDVQAIQQSIKPSFFFAYAELLKTGWKLECKLYKDNTFTRVVSLHPDLDSVKKRTADMREKYPTDKKLVLIIDNIPKEGYNEQKTTPEADLCYRC